MNKDDNMLCIIMLFIIMSDIFFCYVHLLWNVLFLFAHFASTISKLSSPLQRELKNILALKHVLISSTGTTEYKNWNF